MTTTHSEVRLLTRHARRAHRPPCAHRLVLLAFALFPVAHVVAHHELDDVNRHELRFAAVSSENCPLQLADILGVIEGMLVRGAIRPVEYTDFGSDVLLQVDVDCARLSTPDRLFYSVSVSLRRYHPDLANFARPFNKFPPHTNYFTDRYYGTGVKADDLLHNIEHWVENAVGVYILAAEASEED